MPSTLELDILHETGHTESMRKYSTDNTSSYKANKRRIILVMTPDDPESGCQTKTQSSLHDEHSF